MDADALGSCVDLVALEVKVEEDEEDEEEEEGALAAGDALSARLAAAGPGGVAALAAIHSSTSGSSRANWPPPGAPPLDADTGPGAGPQPRDERLRVASYIADAGARRRVAHRLLRKIRFLVDQYAVRCGQQIAVVNAAPARPSRRRQSPAPGDPGDLLSAAADTGLGKEARDSFSCRVVGTEPLSTALRQHADACMLTFASHLQREQLAHKASGSAAVSLFGHDYEASMPPPPPPAPAQGGFALPLLQVDGMPTSLEAMTQADLRVFIPFMLKSALGRGKPFWGNPRCKPVWWPDHVLPWANIKMDTRSEKQKMVCRAWTDALREVVRVCYRHHGLEHLLDLPAAAYADLPEGKRRARADSWQLSPSVEAEPFAHVEDHLLGEAVGGPGADLMLPSVPVCPEEVAERRSSAVLVPTTILLDLKLRPGVPTSLTAVQSPPQ